MAEECMVMGLPPGAELGDKYKILKQLAHGGFGITYIAWDKKLARKLVLKECFPLGLCMRHHETWEVRPISPTHEPMYLRCMDDMYKEACTLSSLNHDRIVSVYDVFCSNGSLFLVMPYLEGGSLRERMDEASRKGQSIPVETVVRWLKQVLDGLSYLHGKGIIHRDIKPGNIMFDEWDNPVLIDFGAALNKPELTSTVTQGEFSRAYAAPEQITGKGEVGAWSDLYSLAATWYELLSGARPEPADQRLVQDDVVALQDARYPSWLNASVMTNLSVQKGKRCPNADLWQSWLKLETRPTQMRWKRLMARMPLVIVAFLVGSAAWLIWLLLPIAVPQPTPIEERIRVESTRDLHSEMRAMLKLEECRREYAEFTKKTRRILKTSSSYEDGMAAWKEHCRDLHPIMDKYPDDEAYISRLLLAKYPNHGGYISSLVPILAEELRQEKENALRELQKAVSEMPRLPMRRQFK